MGGKHVPFIPGGSLAWEDLYFGSLSFHKHTYLLSRDARKRVSTISGKKKRSTQIKYVFDVSIITIFRNVHVLKAYRAILIRSEMVYL
jgi:hypothetical protein